MPIEYILQAINQPLLDEATGPRPRDMPEQWKDRPSYKRKLAQKLLRQAADLAVASTHDDDDQRRQQVGRLQSEAAVVIAERNKQLRDLDRAAWRPATQYTQSAWGAAPGEPLPLFARAIRRTMLELGVPRELADRMVDPGEPEEGKGKGKGVKGKGGKK